MSDNGFRAEEAETFMSVEGCPEKMGADSLFTAPERVRKEM